MEIHLDAPMSVPSPPNWFGGKSMLSPQIVKHFPPHRARMEREDQLCLGTLAGCLCSRRSLLLESRPFLAVSPARRRPAFAFQIAIAGVGGPAGRSRRQAGPGDGFASIAHA